MKLLDLGVALSHDPTEEQIRDEHNNVSFGKQFIQNKCTEYVEKFKAKDNIENEKVKHHVFDYQLKVVIF